MENPSGPGSAASLTLLRGKIVDLGVMENQKDSNYHHGLPGAGKPEEYSGKQQNTD
jgi:hypothetical protein